MGFLPEHVAEQWVAAGKMRALHTATQHYRIPFVLITRHDRRPNRVVDAFLGFISGAKPDKARLIAELCHTATIIDSRSGLLCHLAGHHWRRPRLWR